jgi:SOS regulatory protein LexA
MGRKSIDLKEAAEVLKDFYRQEGRMPSFTEIAETFGYRSKNAAFELVEKLVDQGHLTKDARGRLRLVSSGVRVLGTIQAGLPTAAEEDVQESVSLDSYLVQKPEDTFLVKVQGDSMIDAGIREGDMVLVERGRTAREGDIVVARVDGEWTLKTYERRSGQAVLVPANKRYSVIRPERELTFGGVVIGVIRKY